MEPPIADVLAFCGTREEPRKVIVGGPMMGSAQMDVNYPITRQNNGLLAFGARAAQRPNAENCIRCGRCINSCPWVCPRWTSGTPTCAMTPRHWTS